MCRSSVPASAVQPRCTVENAGATPVILVEVAPAFTFRGLQGASYRLEVFMLLIPTTIAAGETLAQEVTVVDELLPPEPWVSFHERVKVDLTLWFDGFARPVSRQVVVQGCTEAV